MDVFRILWVILAIVLVAWMGHYALEDAFSGGEPHVEATEDVAPENKSLFDRETERLDIDRGSPEASLIGFCGHAVRLHHLDVTIKPTSKVEVNGDGKPPLPFVENKQKNGIFFFDCEARKLRYLQDVTFSVWPLELERG